MGAYKTNNKAIQIDQDLWYIINNWRGYTKINESVNQALYNWVLHHPYIVQYPASNDFFQLSIDVHSEKHL